MATHLITPYEIKLDTDTKEWQYSALISFSPEAFSSLKITVPDALTKFLRANYTKEEPRIRIDVIDIEANVIAAKTPLFTMIQFRQPCLGVLGEFNIPIFPYHIGTKVSGVEDDDLITLNNFSYWCYSQYIGCLVPLDVWDGTDVNGIMLRCHRKDESSWTEGDLMFIGMMGSWVGGK